VTRRRRGEVDETPWPVLSDIMVSILMIVLLLFLSYFFSVFRQRQRELELGRRQAQVEADIRLSVPDSTLVRIERASPERQKLRFASSLLFASCSAKLKPEGEALLRSIGLVLGRAGRVFELIEVEGHTDRRPIGNTCAFPSNWELSSARATAVVVLLASDSLVQPEILSATGRAQYQPVAADEDSLNRRIELILLYREPTPAGAFNRDSILPGF